MSMRAVLRLVVLVGLTVGCAANPPPPESTAPSVAESEIVPGHIYEVEQVTTPPRPTNVQQLGWLLEREYPSALRDAGIGGSVTAKLIIGEAGNVVHADISQRSGYPELDAATLRVVRALNFRPARIGNTPVRVVVELPVRWTISR
jgi:periplasmic protein TonB